MNHWITALAVAAVFIAAGLIILSVSIHYIPGKELCCG